MGCAGGLEAKLCFEQTGTQPADYQTINCNDWFAGGHSGLDIHEGRGNANQLLCRTLFRLQQALPIRIIALNGGTLRNAIPREASALISIPTESSMSWRHGWHKEARLPGKEFQQ